jgi:hypothetical protein
MHNLPSITLLTGQGKGCNVYTDLNHAVHLLQLFLQLLVQRCLLVHGTTGLFQQLCGLLQVATHLMHHLLQLLTLVSLSTVQRTPL